MSTKEEKQSNSGNNSTIKEESTQSFESKFSEESQSNLDCSNSGQQYEIIENTPFAITKSEEGWKIVIGNMFASPHAFQTEKEAIIYVKKKKWELIWTMVIWIINNQEKFKIKEN